MSDSAAPETDEALAEPAAPVLSGGEPTTRRGGRPKGSLNKATRDVRIAAQKYSARALTVIAKLAEKSDDPRVQLQAAVELLDRAHGKPAQTQLVGGTGEDPVRVSNVEPDDHRELARRTISIFSALGLKPVLEAALDAKEAKQTNGAHLATPLQVPQELTSEPTDTEASSETCANGDAAPAPPAAARDRIAELRERPSSGESMWFDFVEIRGLPAQRSGLPTGYAIYEYERLISHANWVRVEEHLVKRFGGLSDLPSGELSKTVPAGQCGPGHRGWLDRIRHA